MRSCAAFAQPTPNEFSLGAIGLLFHERKSPDKFRRHLWIESNAGIRRDPATHSVVRICRQKAHIQGK